MWLVDCVVGWQRVNVENVALRGMTVGCAVAAWAGAVGGL